MPVDKLADTQPILEDAAVLQAKVEDLQASLEVEVIKSADLQIKVDELQIKKDALRQKLVDTIDSLQKLRLLCIGDGADNFSKTLENAKTQEDDLILESTKP
jgi:hypothetical protein